MMAWSSKEVLMISIATGLVFCFATIYAQHAMAKYVDKKVCEKTRQNPFVGMGLVSERKSQSSQTPEDQTALHNLDSSPPPGSGTRWTPLSI